MKSLNYIKQNRLKDNGQPSFITPFLNGDTSEA